MKEQSTTTGGMDDNTDSNAVFISCTEPGLSHGER